MDSSLTTPIMTPSLASPVNGTSTPATTAYSASQAGPPTSNGDQLDVDAESSKMAASEYAHSQLITDNVADDIDYSSDPSLHALSLTRYIFDLGYMNSQWSDVHFTFFDTGANLHRRKLDPHDFEQLSLCSAVIVARSPYLAQLMAPHPAGTILNLTFDDPTITAQVSPAFPLPRSVQLIPHSLSILPYNISITQHNNSSTLQTRGQY
jgi:hypothetical protein